MLLRASTSLSLLPPPSEEKKPSLTASSSLLRLRRRTGFGPAVAMAGRNEANPRPITGVVFQPFEELKNELSLVPASNDNSLARHKYAEDCEAAINEQINVEYNVSYVYHAMFAYFDRDNVALKGLAKFCKESSEEEREHAEKLMKYQNKRGGRVKLQTILMPANEFDHHEKGDALSAMELALSLEKLTHEKLLNMHNVAQQSKDVQMVDFIETEFLGEQVEAIKKISAYVAQLRRVGKGHGVWHFNQMLLHEEEVVAA
ncbi:ferritin-3, chloroplastic-like [Typha angustifolia]|uniref:ferritin-3, chloroplastic-like n=1 Tax=Typha angustifolia TaxID=59011 RepID=UPI003C2C87D1